MEDLTLDNLYSDEFMKPTIRINPQYESWMAAGAPTVDVLAGRMAQDILSKGNPAALDPAITAKLADIIAAFEQENLNA